MTSGTRQSDSLILLAPHLPTGPKYRILLQDLRNATGYVCGFGAG